MQFFFLLESRYTELLGHVYLNEMVIKLTVLLGCKVRNEKTQFKMLLVTNGLSLVAYNYKLFCEKNLLRSQQTQYLETITVANLTLFLNKQIKLK